MICEKAEERSGQAQFVICDVQREYAENLMNIISEKLKEEYQFHLFLESSATERVFREDADQQTSYSGGISGRKEKRDFSRKSLSSDGKKESGKRAGRRG